MEKYLGKVTIEERERARLINLEKAALRELLMTLPISKDAPEPVYDRIKNDYIRLTQSLSEWWLTISKRYNWTFSPTDNWKLDYETNEVFLISPDNN